MNDIIKIDLSKLKLLKIFFIGIVFVSIGFMFMLYPSEFTSNIMRNTMIIRVAGAISIIFFGTGFFFIMIKIFDNNPGLVIDNDGILNNSNMFSSIFIPFTDIKELQIVNVLSTKILILHVCNNKKYIETAKSLIAKKLMLANQYKYGSPISITSGSLKINFEDLTNLITSEWAKRNAS